MPHFVSTFHVLVHSTHHKLMEGSPLKKCKFNLHEAEVICDQNYRTRDGVDKTYSKRLYSHYEWHCACAKPIHYLVIGPVTLAKMCKLVPYQTTLLFSHFNHLI